MHPQIHVRSLRLQDRGPFESFAQLRTPNHQAIFQSFSSDPLPQITLEDPCPSICRSCKVPRTFPTSWFVGNGSHLRQGPTANVQYSSRQQLGMCAILWGRRLRTVSQCSQAVRQSTFLTACPTMPVCLRACVPGRAGPAVDTLGFSAHTGAHAVPNVVIVDKLLVSIMDITRTFAPGVRAAQQCLGPQPV